MPAVTADPLTLDRIEAPDLTSRSRDVRSISDAPSGMEGEGFPVRRAFAGINPGLLDPFIHMDEMGAINYAPGAPKGTPWHPHRGFETVTYMIDGTFQHQDSHGGGGLILDGATQWMTAGSGILHIETPPEALVVSGGLFHGVQLWVNLPAKEKMISPAYQNLEGADVVLLGSPDGGALVRLIAGDIGGAGEGASHRGPGSTRTPITLAHATLSAGAELDLPWNPEHNALVYVLSGTGSIGPDRTPIRAGQLAVLGAGGHISVGASELPDRADSEETAADRLDVMLLGGRPIREPIATHGPFVMNTRAELIQAMDDYQSGAFGRIPPGALQPYRPPAN